MIDLLQTVLVKMFATIAGVAMAASMLFAPKPVDAPKTIQGLANIEIATTTTHTDAPIKEAAVTAPKKQPIPTPSAQIVPEQKSVPAVPPNTILCNGKYWTPTCPTGLKYYCPTTGDAQCIYENVASPAQPQPSPIAQRLSCTERAREQWYKELERAKASGSVSYLPSAASYVSDLCFSDVHTSNPYSQQDQQLHELERRQDELEQAQMRKESDDAINCAWSNGIYANGSCHYF